VAGHRSSKGTTPRKKRIGRAVVGAIGLGAIVFAIQGGEYGTGDLFRQRARKANLLARIDSVQHQVDSLERVKRAIQTSPAVQERIAREEFGMVRGDREILYRFAEPLDSAEGRP
jgi:Septum formation initiator.